MSSVVRFTCTAAAVVVYLPAFLGQKVMSVGESAEQAPGDESPSPADDAEAEDAAVEAALRELFLVPGANDAALSHVALTSWWRVPGMP